MEKSSLIGKKLIIIKEGFREAQLLYLEEQNDCVIINSIQESLDLDFNDYDHFFCRYALDIKFTKELFSKLTTYEHLSQQFMISPSEFDRIEEKELAEEKHAEIAQKQINEYLSKYPDFFKKFEPDFFKKRLISFNIESCNELPPKEIALFNFDRSSLGIISHNELPEDLVTIELKVNISFGEEKNSFNIKCTGTKKSVEFDIEDKSNIFCYEITLKEHNDAYIEVIDALELQEDALSKKLRFGGYE